MGVTIRLLDRHTKVAIPPERAVCGVCGGGGGGYEAISKAHTQIVKNNQDSENCKIKYSTSYQAFHAQILSRNCREKSGRGRPGYEVNKIWAGKDLATGLGY